MKLRPTHKQRAQCAFDTAFELFDAAEWLRREMLEGLRYCGVTMNEFRLMRLLYPNRAMIMSKAAGASGRAIGNFTGMVERVEAEGWVRRRVARRRALNIPEAKLPKARRGKRRVGRKIRVLELTDEGRELIELVLPRQAKAVKMRMRALDLREQSTLTFLCRKLRKGDPVRFWKEMHKRDREEDLMVGPRRRVGVSLEDLVQAAGIRGRQPRRRARRIEFGENGTSGAPATQ